jgi:leucyl aminopeptidase
MCVCLKAAAAGKLAAGVMTGAYEATRFKAKPTVSELKSLAVLTAGDAQAAESAIATAAGMAAGTMLTRWGAATSAQSWQARTLAGEWRRH